MVKAIIPADVGQPDNGDQIEIELKQPAIAGLLAWLVPGLGHVYQGRTGKGMLFFVCILGTFFYGMYLGQGRVVYASTAPPLSRASLERWQYYCQLGVGLPALPALVQRNLSKGESGLVRDVFRLFGVDDPKPVTLFGQPYMAPPDVGLQETIDDSNRVSKQPNEQAKWIVDMHPNFELGTVYTVIAGLLNVLVICDAYGGPLIIRHKPKEAPDGGGEPAKEKAPAS